jgi:hypothetical protein
MVFPVFLVVGCCAVHVQLDLPQAVIVQKQGDRSSKITGPIHLNQELDLRRASRQLEREVWVLQTEADHDASAAVQTQDANRAPIIVHREHARCFGARWNLANVQVRLGDPQSRAAGKHLEQTSEADQENAKAKEAAIKALEVHCCLLDCVEGTQQSHSQWR